jgi:hypothetical protein
MNDPDFDFEYITKNIGLALGMIPIKGNAVAVHPGAIASIEHAPDTDRYIMTLQGGEIFGLTPKDMKDLEITIKRRIEDSKEQVYESMKFQGQLQARFMKEAQQGIEAVKGTIIEPGTSPKRPPWRKG